MRRWLLPHLLRDPATSRAVLSTDYMPCLSGEEKIYMNIEFCFYLSQPKGSANPKPYRNLNFVGFVHCNILKIVLTIVMILRIWGCACLTYSATLGPDSKIYHQPNHL